MESHAHALPFVIARHPRPLIHAWHDITWNLPCLYSYLCAQIRPHNVQVWSNPKKVRLTAEGTMLAAQLYKDAVERCVCVDLYLGSEGGFRFGLRYLGDCQLLMSVR